MKRKINLGSSVYTLIGIFILIFFLNVTAFSQTRNIFESGESLIDFLNKKRYSVPGYGFITFEYNRSDTKKMRDSREKDNSSDEIIDLIFDVSVRRINSKMKDKGDYKVELRIYLNDPTDDTVDPNYSHINGFTLSRNIIYPIKGFPSNYIIFSDGEMYFKKTTYKKIGLEEYKNLVLSNNKIWSFGYLNDIPYGSSSYVKCEEVN